MTKDYIFQFLILIHFLADFALQTNEQATQKSSNNKMLFFHVSTYSLTWFLALLSIHNLIGITLNGCFLFAFITLICHYITDYFTSRLSKPFFAKQDYHNGFVVVGFDQMLHYIQLYYTFKLIN